jgi:tetratricopeptide (TPR) repeat protein
MSNLVNVWQETVSIPTYKIGKPEKNPIFLEKRVYQGSSGVVYPHPVVEKISDQKEDQFYNALFIENQYIKVMILPELGGRIQMAWDKVQQRHFIYYNQVIKPALVGLTGPWISGGIEFNWPQHHRPSTFNAVDYDLKENEDGSKTVWINEVELMFRTKGTVGFTLYPEKAYIEISGKLYNRTPFAQTFLWWANPAVKVNDYYQSVFPPDVNAVFDHGKRDVSTFPIATGTYYKVDYSPGTDISRYKNIPVPTSYMAIKSKYDFMGGYEHDTQAGLLHVANHHTSPGKKQWTWGNGDFGQAWDRNLTDEDGPYIELMTGMFTDNQPDFSWINPQEEKTFTQYFMPYSKIGLVKNATKEAMLNLEETPTGLSIKVYATQNYNNATIVLKNKGNIVFETTTTISPKHVFETEIPLTYANLTDFEIVVCSQNGTLLVNYQPENNHQQPIPQAAQPAKLPQDIETTELLYLNGLHLEQYRHATYSAKDYYEEALRRDANDVRNNNALGLWYLKRGKFATATPYFEKAIATLTLRNPNPYDGEPYYNLGWALKLQGKPNQAYDAFYKSTWNHAQQHASFFALSTIAAAQNKWNDALKLAQQSLVQNWHSHSVRHLIAALFRKNNQPQKATKIIEESLQIDAFNFGCQYEHYLLLKNANNEGEANSVLIKLKTLMRNYVHNYIEYALDYAKAGFYAEAIAFLQIFVADNINCNPMVYYYIGYFSAQIYTKTEALNFYEKAAKQSPDYCFPHRIEDVSVLQHATITNPTDAKAPYYLGNFWYDKRQYTEAIACWENAASKDASFPTVFRNLSLAYHNQLNNTPKAIKALENAFSLDTTDARVLMELDQLYKKTNYSLTFRLNLLQQYPVLVNSRDDLYLEKITLLNNLGQYNEAYQLINSRQFHPWEGGEGKVLGQFLLVNIALAQQQILNNNFNEALKLLANTNQYPHNLGEGKLYGAQENDIEYFKACAYAGLQNQNDALIYFNKATLGISEPVQAIFYNDPQPDKIFYQGLAWLKLNQKQKAHKIFNRLIEFGTQHLNSEVKLDYFAVSLPDLLVFDQDLNLKNNIHCLYLQGLGNLGLANYAQAQTLFNQILTHNVHHQGAIVHLASIAFLQHQNHNHL